jgi:hypothetical protein
MAGAAGSTWNSVLRSPRSIGRKRLSAGAGDPTIHAGNCGNQAQTSVAAATVVPAAAITLRPTLGLLQFQRKTATRRPSV